MATNVSDSLTIWSLRGCLSGRTGELLEGLIIYHDKGIHHTQILVAQEVAFIGILSFEIRNTKPKGYVTSNWRNGIPPLANFIEVLESSQGGDINDLEVLRVSNICPRQQSQYSVCAYLHIRTCGWTLSGW